MFLMEHCDSRTIDVSVSQQKAELHLGLFGLDDENVVMALVEAFVPATFRTWPFEGYGLDPLGAGNWDVTVRYSGKTQDLDDQKDDMASFSFDTTGGKQKLRRSLVVKRAAAIAGRQPWTNGGLIGVNGDKVEGCEVPLPQMKFTISGHLPQSLVTFDYAQQCKRLVGKVNAAKFKKFDRGEVMFMGNRGGWKGLEKAELTFDFAVSENDDDFTIGEGADAIPPEGEEPIVKEGWWYADVQYEDALDDAAKKRIKKPVAVIIHQVVKYGDFTVLGIGS